MDIQEGKIRSWSKMKTYIRVLNDWSQVNQGVDYALRPDPVLCASVSDG